MRSDSEVRIVVPVEATCASAFPGVLLCKNPGGSCENAKGCFMAKFNEKIYLTRIRYFINGCEILQCNAPDFCC